MKTESWALADVIQGEIRMQELPEIVGVATSDRLHIAWLGTPLSDYLTKCINGLSLKGYQTPV